jgi:hypothetical protein
MDNIEKRIEERLKDSIKNYFKNKEVTTIHPLDLIFPKERRIRSLIGGLETSLGTRLWEPLAELFAELNGFEVLNKNEFNKQVPIIPTDIIHKISDFEARKLSDMSLSHAEFFNDIRGYIAQKNTNNLDTRKIPKGEGVDLWLRKDNFEYLIDIKTVQINAGSGPKFNKNLLNWYVYSALKKTKYDLKCLIGFPYNPHYPKDYWKKEGGKVKPLIPSDEALVGDEFWDFLSGMNGTTKLIFDVFKKLGEQDFGNKFDDIFNPVNLRNVVK